MNIKIVYCPDRMLLTDLPRYPVHPRSAVPRRKTSRRRTGVFPRIQGLALAVYDLDQHGAPRLRHENEEDTRKLDGAVGWTEQVLHRHDERACPARQRGIAHEKAAQKGVRNALKGPAADPHREKEGTIRLDTSVYTRRNAVVLCTSHAATSHTLPHAERNCTAAKRHETSKM